ncbi:MAG: methylisocitrate lyase [Deltaproteobacteria bacterium]|nr:methylisocitrate lyase [Deltaproteobacteria bacterium]
MNNLKRLLKKGGLIAPGAFNAASAMLIEKAGFPVVYISGAGLSNSSGRPDTGLLTLEETAVFSSYIVNSVKIPAIVDADTGFGGPREVKRAVETFEEIGAGAIQLEDQAGDKRCGHLAGKKLVSAKEFVAKIKAAVNARKSKGFLIIARTDASAVSGLSDAVDRARLYIEAGADIIFPEALASREEFAAFSRAVDAPLMANMTEFGKTPYIMADEFFRLGYSLVIFPMTAFRITMRATEDALATLRKKGTQKDMLGKMQTREELYKLLGYKPEG